MLSFNKKLFFYLFIAFILATVIGTITHECGHYIVAKILGFGSELHYASTSWWPGPKTTVASFRSSVFLIILAGPLQTMLTGTIGFILLLFFKKSFINSEKFSFRQWVIVFLSLFWLRPIANFFIWSISYLLSGVSSSDGDEIRISRICGIPDWSLPALTAFLGLLVVFIVIFRFIPITHRFTFVVAGLAGGAAGYLIWIVWLGKFILP